MLNETFYLDGIDAGSVGIRLQTPVVFSKAVPVIETQTIPGRNGNLVFETGSYENRVGSASCFCLQEDVETAISSAGRFLIFQSTLPVWGATYLAGNTITQNAISIHAPRVGSDRNGKRRGA